MQKKLIGMFLVLLCLTLGYAQDPEEWRGKIVSITDGDTLKVSLEDIVCPLHKGGLFTIRMFGIDTPESKDNKKAKRDAREQKVSVEQIVSQGKKAFIYLQSVLPVNTTVTIQPIKPYQDVYGRMLALIWVDKVRIINGKEINAGGECINAQMLAEGYAIPFMIKGTEWDRDFEKYYQKAKAGHKGLWKE